MSEDFPDSPKDLARLIDDMIKMQSESTTTLENILETLRNGRPLMASTREYLKNMIFQHYQNLELKKGIEKNRTSFQKKSETTSSDETDLANLKHRLASGTLSYEEYQKIRNVLVEGKKDEEHEIQFEKITSKEPIREKRIKKERNASTAIWLAVAFGLVGIPGIGHIYLGKESRGFGIIALSFVIISIGFLVFSIHMQKIAENDPFFLYGIMIAEGWAMLFAWQLYDVNKLRKIYEKHVAQAQERPPWW